MRNRIHNAWDSIIDEDLRRRIAGQEHVKAQACWDMLPESQVVFRILCHPHPTQPGLLLGHLVLFVGDLPAMTVASGRRKVE